MCYSLLRPLLFLLPPETAHHITLSTLALAARCGIKARPAPSTPRTVMGLQFPNPIGVAAGLDKNGDYIAGLAALGFGFIEIGTVTPKPQSGNPKPRLFRLPKAEALINRMGFNNRGVDYLVARVQQTAFSGILGINIGKNATTPLHEAASDYLYGLQRVYPYASYITVNISSPNTPGLRQLQDTAALDALLQQLKNAQAELAQQHSKYVPLVVKIAPDVALEQLPDMARIFIKQRIDGIIAGNTTVTRPDVQGLTHADETGGLSGRPLFTRALTVVQQLVTCLQGEIPVIACGGITTQDDAAAMLAAGASLLQVYTSLVYHGPKVIKALCCN